MNFENITVEAKEQSTNQYSEEIYHYALSEACAGYHWRSNVIEIFFTEGRILQIWNKYPEFRSDIFNNIILRFSRYSSDMGTLKSQSFKEDCKKIVEQIISDKKSNTTAGWARINDQLKSEGYPAVNYDYNDILKSLENNQVGEDYHFWLERYMKTLTSDDEEVFEELYFSIKRAPGATEVRRFILEAAINKEALSEKILSKIVKSAPISLRRSIVENLCSQKRECDNILYYEDPSRRKWRAFSDKDFDDARKKSDKLESKLILFAPIQDYQIQSNLVDSLKKDNLVWIVPAVSSLGRSYLTDRLQRKMS